MKKSLKSLGLLALVMLVGFAFIACGGDDDEEEAAAVGGVAVTGFSIGGVPIDTGTGHEFFMIVANSQRRQGEAILLTDDIFELVVDGTPLSVTPGAINDDELLPMRNNVKIDLNSPNAQARLYLYTAAQILGSPASFSDSAMNPQYVDDPHHVITFEDWRFDFVNPTQKNAFDGANDLFVLWTAIGTDGENERFYVIPIIRDDTIPFDLTVSGIEVAANQAVFWATTSDDVMDITPATLFSTIGTHYTETPNGDASTFTSDGGVLHVIEFDAVPPTGSALPLRAGTVPLSGTGKDAKLSVTLTAVTAQ